MQVTECYFHECLLALRWVHRHGTHMGGTWLLCICKWDLICIPRTFSTWGCSQGDLPGEVILSTSVMKASTWGMEARSSRLGDRADPHTRSVSSHNTVCVKKYEKDSCIWSNYLWVVIVTFSKRNMIKTVFYILPETNHAVRITTEIDLFLNLRFNLIFLNLISADLKY